jgi:hypothetical protein
MQSRITCLAKMCYVVTMSIASVAGSPVNAQTLAQQPEKSTYETLLKALVHCFPENHKFPATLFGQRFAQYGDDAVGVEATFNWSSDLIIVMNQIPADSDCLRPVSDSLTKVALHEGDRFNANSPGYSTRSVVFLLSHTHLGRAELRRVLDANVTTNFGTYMEFWLAIALDRDANLTLRYASSGGGASYDSQAAMARFARLLRGDTGVLTDILRTDFERFDLWLPYCPLTATGYLDIGRGVCSHDADENGGGKVVVEMAAARFPNVVRELIRLKDAREQLIAANAWTSLATWSQSRGDVEPIADGLSDARSWIRGVALQRVDLLLARWRESKSAIEFDAKVNALLSIPRAEVSQRVLETLTCAELDRGATVNRGATKRAINRQRISRCAR